MDEGRAGRAARNRVVLDQKLPRLLVDEIQAAQTRMKCCRAQDRRKGEEA